MHEIRKKTPSAHTKFFRDITRTFTDFSPTNREKRRATLPALDHPKILGQWRVEIIAVRWLDEAGLFAIHPLPDALRGPGFHAVLHGAVGGEKNKHPIRDAVE